MSAITCPLCSGQGSKALIGPFPIKICLDDSCGCAWGIFVTGVFWLADRLQPCDSEEPGWLIALYTGSYFYAIWRSLGFGGGEA